MLDEQQFKLDKTLENLIDSIYNKQNRAIIDEPVIRETAFKEIEKIITKEFKLKFKDFSDKLKTKKKIVLNKIDKLLQEIFQKIEKDFDNKNDSELLLKKFVSINDIFLEFVLNKKFLEIQLNKTSLNYIISSYNILERLVLATYIKFFWEKLYYKKELGNIRENISEKYYSEFSKEYYSNLKNLISVVVKYGKQSFL